MMKKIFSIPHCLILLIAISFCNGCVRERDTDTSMASELTKHEFLFHDVVDLADDAATKKTGEKLSNYKTRGYCATLTHNNTTNPRSIVIDFGTSNCMCNDGRERRGKILVSYTDNYSDSGSVHNITFDNYHVDGFRLMGSNDIFNNGKNGAGQPFYTSTIAGKLLDPNQIDTLFYESERTITWVQGSNTIVYGDDVYEISGNGSGRNALRTYYAMTITQPLIKDVLGCRFFNKGRIEMQPQGKALRTIDFGDGSCDNDATVTINNKVFNIKL